MKIVKMEIPCKLIFAITLCIQLSCAERTDPKFKPGSDPFVRKLFEQHLAEAGIAYKMDSEGFYISSQESVDKMRAISNKAFSEASQTSSLEVMPGCTLDRLLHQLDENKVIYVIDRGRQPYLVKTTNIDAKKYHVMESYAEAQSVCGKKQEPQKRESIY